MLPQLPWLKTWREKIAEEDRTEKKRRSNFGFSLSLSLSPLSGRGSASPLNSLEAPFDLNLLEGTPALLSSSQQQYYECQGR
mmetsp:Transcript_38700/g.76080  ORF Transcript_38700/g.76080 Transcript_38700/m.76080 type:complete len:82 (+) Transcript_38700:153-398(+)